MDLINRIREKLESGEMKLYGVNAWTQERVRLKPYRDGFVVCDADLAFEYDRSFYRSSEYYDHCGCDQSYLFSFANVPLQDLQEKYG